MKLSIVGTGYVGLVTGACFAEVGHEVVCVDRDGPKVERINRGETPIHERGLETLLRRHVGRGLTASTDLRAAVHGTEMTFIAVGTPFDGKAIDLTAIRQAALDIGAALRDKPDYHVVVVKSTVVPGTTADVVRGLLEEASGKRAGADFGVGANPEFLTEGVAVQDFMDPDRIVVGGDDARTTDMLARAYAPFAGAPLVRTNTKTAEMIKYTSNAVLATLVSFSNEIGNLCARLGGVDMVDVMHGLHLARYFTTLLSDGRQVTAPITSFLYAGCGFGGSCLPKDVKALIAHGHAAGEPMAMLDTVLAINEAQPARVLEILDRHFPTLRGVHVSVLGLTFKPETDDMRGSPAIAIVGELLARGAAVSAFDPVGTESAKRVLPADRIRFAADLPSALAGADAAVIVTAWNEFRRLPDLLDSMDAPPLIVDGRRMLDKRRIARYAGIGMGGPEMAPRTLPRSPVPE
jgi:UDPglucose 6-dehydrogenase/GDP-mannose 6-dehydrogenase